MTVTHYPDELTVPEAARRAGVSPSTLRREIADGHIATTRIRSCVRINIEELDRYLRSRTVLSSPASSSGPAAAVLRGDDSHSPAPTRGAPDKSDVAKTSIAGNTGPGES